MGLAIGTRARLSNGVEMPCLGLGVYQAAPGREARQAVTHALKVGYRLIDTASMYGNEADVGKAVRESGLPRQEVFITTKLWNTDHGFRTALRACHDSLERLGLDYLDLYLIHWPVQGRRQETWQAMEQLLTDGICRAVGVSNYTVRHLEELAGYARVLPAVNQVEFSPFLYQRELLQHCKERGIQLEAYSPLTKGYRFKHPTLGSVARKHGKSPAQVMIRWCLQHAVVAIPKSTNARRIEENAAVFDFELDEEDMAVLDGLDESLRTGWDPSEMP